VPSYRDRQNPEAVRFPGNFVPKLVLALGLIANVLGLVSVAAVGAPWWNRVLDVILLLGTSLVYLKTWPRVLVTDQFGLHKLGWRAKSRISIAWNEIQSVQPGRELGGDAAAGMGLATDTLVITGSQPGQRIVHTPRHPDRARLLLEMRQHGVKLD